MSQVFGDIAQVGYITRDLKQSVHFFLDNAGIGPWFVSEPHRITHATYLGRPCDVEITVAIANSGSLQIEIIQPTLDVRSVYSDWLARYPTELLFQHLSSWPSDYKDAYERAISKGFNAIVDGRPPQGPYAYFQHSDKPELLFEIAAATEPRRRKFEAIKAAARDWDGSQPIRPAIKYSTSLD